MNKKNMIYALLVSAGIVSGQAFAQDAYRLAYSKSDDIEIFIDGATQDSWCKEALDLRIVGGANATLEGFSSLLPKLGGLFAQQCPQTNTLTWRFVDQTAKELAQGTSSAAQGWTATQTVEVASAVEAPLTVEADPVRDQETAHAVEAVPVRTQPLSNFAVGDWTPPSTEERVELQEKLATRKNQDGCQIYTSFDFGAQDDYINVVTDGIACNADGFLHGAGTLQLMRSDGVAMMRPIDIWMQNGMPFNGPVEQLHPDAISLVNGNTYWFSLGSNDNLQSHYFLVSKLQGYQGLGIWRVEPELNVLTANSESFKQAGLIEEQIKQAITMFDLLNMSKARSMSIRFADNVEEGLYRHNYNGLLYGINADRKMPYRGEPGPWQYNMQRASNYLFDREQRLAEQRKQEEQRKQFELEQAQRQQEMNRKMALRTQAREESQRLDRYEGLSQLNLADPQVMHNAIYENISFEPGYINSYERLLRGSKRDLSTLVEVTGSKDKDAIVSWPYEMRLVDQANLAKGWYWIQGSQYLDDTQLDKKGLPITRVETNAETIYACKEKQCTDLQDPVVLIRQMYGLSEWDPTEAKKIVEEASAGYGF